MTTPTLKDVKEFFRKQPDSSLWIPTKTRNAIIADEGFSSEPRFIAGGRVYRWEFKSIGGGMWEVRLGDL